MFHVEIRQFPHNFSRFNLGEEQLRPIVEPWVRDRPVEFGERRWSPFEARLTILEGPELSLQQLSMGRGWRTAQHKSEDVTERVLGAAREAAERAAAAAAPGHAQAPGAGAPAGAEGDPLALAVALAALLGPDAVRLLEAWRAVAQSSPELTPSQALALAEHNLASTANAG